MSVYIEYAILDNLSMDCLLLLLATSTLKLPTKWYRILLGGAVGSISSLLCVTLTGAILYVAKVLSLLLMCIATVGIGKKLLWCVFSTALYTFLLGGAIIGVFNLSAQSFVGGVIYQSDVPLFCYFFAILLAVVLVKMLMAYIKDVKNVLPNVFRCQIVLDGVHNVNALYDSGNGATCNGLALCFVSKKFCDVFAKRMLCGQTQNVSICTVAGKCTVMATKGQVGLSGQRMDVYFAIGKMSHLHDVILASGVGVGAQTNCGPQR